MSNHGCCCYVPHCLLMPPQHESRVFEARLAPFPQSAVFPTDILHDFLSMNCLADSVWLMDISTSTVSDKWALAVFPLQSLNVFVLFFDFPYYVFSPAYNKMVCGRSVLVVKVNVFNLLSRHLAVSNLALRKISIYAGNFLDFHLAS